MELISREATIKSLFDYHTGKKTIGQCIDDVPTIQAVPIEVLQEIRQEIEDEAWSMKCIDDDMYELEDKAVDLEDVLRIIDTHISALNNDQFERIWQNTVEEMKRRKMD